MNNGFGLQLQGRNGGAQEGRNDAAMKVPSTGGI